MTITLTIPAPCDAGNKDEEEDMRDEGADCGA